jgi:S1-C subfamily serine protease
MKNKKLAYFFATLTVILMLGFSLLIFGAQYDRKEYAEENKIVLQATPIYQRETNTFNQKKYIEDELADFELWTLSRISHASKRASEENDKTLDEVDKVKLNLNEVRFKASDFSQTTTNVLPSIVKIKVSVPTRMFPIDNEIGMVAEYDDNISVFGSGFIVDSQGTVVTNKHVANAYEEICEIFECIGEPTYEIITGDGRVGLVSSIKASSTYDLASIRTNLRGQYLQLENSDKIKQGEQTIAVGNPGIPVPSETALYDIEPQDYTVTQGIVSGTKRNLKDGLGKFWLQTDTPVNPGNSGGPLLTKDGKVIGVVTLKPSLTEGIGYAIPSNIVKEFLGQ